MIKFVVKKPESVLLGLGLSAKNVEKLREGLPILVKGTELCPELKGVEVAIFFGETEKDMYEDIKKQGISIGQVIGVDGMN